MAERGQQPIIKKVVKKGHGGHHGGAWKVAYADFVTAMMAFFMVMWLVASSPQETREVVADYFRNPGVFHTTGAGGRKIAPVMPDPTASGDGGTYNTPPGASPGMPQVKEAVLSPREALVDILRVQQQSQQDTLKQVGEHLQTRLASSPELQRLKDQVAIEINDDGLRIELLDREGFSFFEVGSAQFKSEAAAVIRAIANEIRGLSNAVVVEGHTDSRPFTSKSNRSNWELSTDRAHSARRLLEAFNVQSERIAQVRGYANRKLRYPTEPYDVRNRRISFAILYNS
ncbi:MAG: flagellar motor protein MotB [Candidatus Tectimicrobiota bacterium]